MAHPPKLSRRNFVKLCSSAIPLIASSSHLLAQPGVQVRTYHRVQLVSADGRPLTAGDLPVGENFVFNYPYICTPCFLLNLGEVSIQTCQLETEDGGHYQWKGGVGPQRSIVAFSAICSHQMTHPARPVSFIRYRHEEAEFRKTDKEMEVRPHVIYCCSEKSVYDPAAGARVLGGPAPQPLATILLEEDSADRTIYATGTSGGEMFTKFFNKFAERLILEHKTSRIQEQVTGTTPVIPLAEYSRTQVTC